MREGTTICMSKGTTICMSKGTTICMSEGTTICTSEAISIFQSMANIWSYIPGLLKNGENDLELQNLLHEINDKIFVVCFAIMMVILLPKNLYHKDLGQILTYLITCDNLSLNQNILKHINVIDGSEEQIYQRVRMLAYQAKCKDEIKEVGDYCDEIMLEWANIEHHNEPDNNEHTKRKIEQTKKIFEELIDNLSGCY